MRCGCWPFCRRQGCVKVDPIGRDARYFHSGTRNRLPPHGRSRRNPANTHETEKYCRFFLLPLFCSIRLIGSITVLSQSKPNTKTGRHCCTFFCAFYTPPTRMQPGWNRSSPLSGPPCVQTVFFWHRGENCGSRWCTQVTTFVPSRWMCGVAW